MIDRIVGHYEQIKYLKNLIERRDSSSQFPSTFLFHGPFGVGKKKTAIEFSKELNCTGSGNEECPSCKRIKNRENIDVQFFSPENKSLKIKKIRELLKESSSSKLSSKWKIFIIDDAHFITPEGADALLKTIEEGRESFLFILISSEKKEMARTLVSRSISLSFQSLSEENLKEVLEDYKDHKKYEIGIRLARGSVKRGKYFLEGEGFQIRKNALGFMKGLVNGISEYKIIRFLDDLDKNQRWEFLDLFYTFIRDVFMIQSGLNENVLNKDQIDHLEEISNQVNEDDLFNSKEIIENTLNKKYLPIQEDHTMKSTFLNFQKEVHE